MLKENKGITLIALVITIIVLLILAGVTIAMLTGENGILGRATETKATNAEAQSREQAKLVYMAVRTEIASNMTSNGNYSAAANATTISNTLNITSELPSAQGWTVTPTDGTAPSGTSQGTDGSIVLKYHNDSLAQDKIYTITLGQKTASFTETQ